jgi:hypothetical protein
MFLDLSGEFILKESELFDSQAVDILRYDCLMRYRSELKRTLHRLNTDDPN